jgi:hypothetical protein
MPDGINLPSPEGEGFWMRYPLPSPSGEGGTRSVTEEVVPFPHSPSFNLLEIVYKFLHECHWNCVEMDRQ